MIPKFPRTFHLPFSLGKGSDDKVHINCDLFLNRQIVISEKLDGGNTGIDSTGVYSRSRNGIATHPSYNKVKSWYFEHKNIIEENNLLLYFENMIGIHSIEYRNLDSFMYLISALKYVDNEYVFLD